MAGFGWEEGVDSGVTDDESMRPCEQSPGNYPGFAAWMPETKLAVFKSRTLLKKKTEKKDPSREQSECLVRYYHIGRLQYQEAHTSFPHFIRSHRANSN